jgi:methionyl-tRNA formyltransferase
MNIVFAGTPDFAAAHLQALIDAKHTIKAVYTQPDRPAGRGKQLKASAVKELALEHNFAIEQPDNFKSDDTIKRLKQYQADIMIVVAYGLLLPKTVLTTPPLGCLNVHGSLLPKWRGAAPIQRAIWAGDSETGVAIMQMDEGLDTGDVLLQKSINVVSDDTSASMYKKLEALGPVALLECLEQLPTLSAVKQDDSQATYAKKLSKAEAKCDWTMPCEQLERNVRAFNPWPMAWFEYEGQNVKIHRAQNVIQNDITQSDSERGNDLHFGRVINYSKQGLDIACKGGMLRITSLQMPGKKAQEVAQIVNGNPDLFCVGSVV